MPKVMLATALLDQDALEDATTVHKQTAVDRFG
jgi:hypothetical protein